MAKYAGILKKNIYGKMEKYGEILSKWWGNTVI
jgi:hypothetical protein